MQAAKKTPCRCDAAIWLKLGASSFMIGFRVEAPTRPSVYVCSARLLSMISMSAQCAFLSETCCLLHIFSVALGFHSSWVQCHLLAAPPDPPTCRLEVCVFFDLDGRRQVDQSFPLCVFVFGRQRTQSSSGRHRSTSLPIDFHSPLGMLGWTQAWVQGGN